MLIKSMAQGLLQLFAPELCYYCWAQQPWQGSRLCLDCSTDLPIAVDFDNRHNHVTKHLWGRIEVTHGAAYFNYWRNSQLKTILHLLKYRGKKNIGRWMGDLLGARIRKCPLFGDIDVVVYVPLHPVKQRRRGYNQSRVIAQGVLPHLGPHCKLVDNSLHKANKNTSQTSKSRADRLSNVLSVYSMGNPTAIKGRSVLLIDDVMTTGATVEACGALLLQAGASKLYVATAAVARM